MVTTLHEGIPPVLEKKGVFKCFGGVKALADARLTLYAGEVHALLGWVGGVGPVAPVTECAPDVDRAIDLHRSCSAGERPIGGGMTPVRHLEVPTTNQMRSKI